MSFLKNMFRRGTPARQTMTLEGVLGPNQRLEDAQARQTRQGKAIAVAADGALLLAEGNRLTRIPNWNGKCEVVHEAEAPIVAMAVSPSGAVALIEDGGTVRVLAPDFSMANWPTGNGLTAPADAAFLSEDELLVADSGLPGPDLLARAAWEQAETGAVLSFTRDGQRRVICQDLHAPAGLCVDPAGRILVTEMERARIRNAVSGEVLKAGLPGYAARLKPRPGGFLLSCLARRDPLIEFLKTEDAFVREMKAAIAPEHWIAPRIDPEFSHAVPIEMGATRLFGEVKAWAPSFSYGLVIELDSDLNPTGSLQSRANGRRHAIADAVHWNGSTVALSLATGELLLTEHR